MLLQTRINYMALSLNHLYSFLLQIISLQALGSFCMTLPMWSLS